MIVDRRKDSKLWKQYQKSLEEKMNLDFETGSKYHSARKKINVEGVKQKL